MRSFKNNNMKKLYTYLVAFVFFSGCTLHSVVAIDAGKQFVLGGGQTGLFRVEAENVGKTSVQIFQRVGLGEQKIMATLAAGQKGTVVFSNGSSAILLNQGNEQANVKVKVTGKTNLGMRYEKNR
jgi:hypothetical protein